MMTITLMNMHGVAGLSPTIQRGAKGDAMATTPAVKIESALKIVTYEIFKLHDEITGHLKQSLEKAVRIGELLSHTKEALRHGEFGPWIEKNVPFTDRTARNYMRLYSERDRLKTETVSDLKTAYRLLAAPEKTITPSEPENAILLWYTQKRKNNPLDADIVLCLLRNSVWHYGLGAVPGSLVHLLQDLDSIPTETPQKLCGAGCWLSEGAM